MQWARRLVCIGVVVSLLVALGGGMAAAQGNKNNPWERGLKLGVMKKVFADEDEAPWARGYMAKMKLRGLMQGYPGGKFMPNTALSRVELVVLAVRVKGLEDEAKSRNDAVLPFSDSETIYQRYPWAVGYLAAADRADLLPSDTDRFQPEKAATRLWAAEVLIKAMSLEDEAEDMMDEDLPYSDEREIPDDKIGYVALALERGIMMGDGNAFRPNAPIRRCEVAAVLDRLQEALPPLGYEVRGVISDVDASDDTITLRVYNTNWWNWQTALRRAYTGSLFTTTVTIRVSDDALILLNKSLVELDDLEAGYRATVLRNSSGEAVLVDAQSNGVTPNWPDSGVVTKSGEVKEIDTGSTPEITIEDGNGKEWTYRIASNCDVEKNGDDIDLDEVEVGDEVTLRIVDSRVTKIVVEDEVVESEKDGEVTDLRLTSSPKRITIRLSNGSSFTASISSSVVVKEDGVTMDLEDIEEGDEVHLDIRDGYVVRIEIENSVAREYEGTVKEIDSGSTPEITIEDSDGRERTFEIASNCDVEKDGEAIDLDEVEVGDQVTLKVVDSKVTEIVVEDEVVESEKDGEVTDLRLTSSPKRITIRLSNGSSFTASISSSVVVKEDGDTIDLDDISLGDEVHLDLRDGYVVRIEIEERASQQYEGTVLDIYTSGSSKRIRLQLDDDRTMSATISSSVVVKYDGAAASLSDVRDGDEVTITVEDSVVTRIDISEREVTEKAGVVTQVETGANARIWIRVSSSSIESYSVASGVHVKYGDDDLHLEEIVPGDEVELKISDSKVTDITITDRPESEVEGTIKAVSSTSGRTITIEDSSGRDVTYRVSSDVTIKKGVHTLSFSELDEDDEVTLKLAGNLVVQVTVEE